MMGHRTRRTGRGSGRASITLAAALATLMAAVLAAPASGASTAARSAGTARTAAAAVHAADETSPPVLSVKPCPDSEFRCVVIRVPWDHFAAAGSAGASDTVDLTFALHRATGARRGTWVTATGGPGTSGIAAADAYAAAMDPWIVTHYDLVFFDQRGTGASAPLACPKAATAWYLSPADGRDPSQDAATLEAARTLASDCVAESKVDPAGLPLYATRQSVEDLEAFRRYLAVATLDLYGESYGTQYMQTYAIAHPDHVRSLILDGPVDLTLPITEAWPEAARAMDRTLLATLAACTDDPACRRDVVGHDATRAYDRVARSLAARTASWRFPLASGKTVMRPFAATDLQTVAIEAMYGQWSRMELQRAVAALSRSDRVPVQRLLYSDLGVDPETLRVTPDPSWSDAAYYAIECADYAMPAGATGDVRAAAYLTAVRAAGVGSARLGRVAIDDLPCAYWPGAPTAETRPPAITDHAYPLLVLVADMDPITPIEGAERIAGRAPDARLVVQTGGPHILYGRGVACVDDVVTALLKDGTLPGAQTTCAGDLTEPYLPLPPATKAAATDPLAVATAVDTWIATLPDYQWWDGMGSVAVGCDFGGRFSFAPRGETTTLAMRACVLTRGLPLRATGSIAANGIVRLTIVTELGTLRYFRGPSGARHVIGTWRGHRVDAKG